MLKLRKAVIGIMFINRTKKLLPVSKIEFMQNNDALTISQIQPVNEVSGAAKLLFKLKLPYDILDKISSEAKGISQFNGSLLASLSKGNKHIKS